MKNPNNCSTCQHKQNPDGGHCYMFRKAPTEVCALHTGYKELFSRFGGSMLKELILKELTK